MIIGAGGHGKVVADIAQKFGYTDISFLDDNAQGSCLGFAVVGGLCDIEKYNDKKTDFFIAVGNNFVRKKIAEQYELNWATLIHPSAQIGSQVKLGCGCVVMPGAIINSCAEIGKHCIINTCAVVEHDNILEDYVHISPNAVLAGTVHIGTCTHIGIGAAVRNNVTICSDCMIGMGAVVVNNISEPATYLGIPAKKQTL